MALTPRIVTRRTRLFGALLFTALLATVWAVAEFAPQWVLPEQLDAAPTVLEDHQPAPYRTPDHLAFQPAEDRGEDRLCAWTARQVWLHFDRLAAAEQVAMHTREVADLVEAYIDLGCPARVHRGDWHVNAEVLGVGLVYETLEPQATVYDPNVTFDPRAAQLVPTAAGTFEVLAPSRMCKEALQGNVTSSMRESAPALYDRCLRAFGRRVDR